MSDVPLENCPKCGCREMFTRKDFPQKVGLGFVVVAGIAFLILAAWRETFWIGAMILLFAAVIDLGFYAVVPKMTVCYRCRAEFRGPINPMHEGYELAVGEKYRHQ